MLSVIKLTGGFELEQGKVPRYQDLRLETRRRLTERDTLRSTGATQQQRTVQKMKEQRVPASDPET